MLHGDMTRRIVLAILGTLVAALLLVGAGTLLLTTLRARQDTRRELVQQVTELANGLETMTERGQPPRPGVLNVVAKALKLNGIAVLFVAQNGTTTGTLPPGIALTEAQLATLKVGGTVSGFEGSLAFAGASAETARGTAIVVASRRASNGLRPGIGWFLLSSAVVVALGAAVALSLSRRITRPLREATLATHQIAAGALATRLVEPPTSRPDELTDLAQSINAMAEGLERSKGLEQQFLLSISHDLRTPLTSIRGYAEAIADGTAPDHERAAAVIVREAERLDRLVRDLLDLARLQAKTFSFERRPVDLSAIAVEVVAAFGPEAGPLSLALVAPTAVPVVGDADRLAQVIGNLVQNALKYARSAVTIAVNVDGRTAVVLVDDDGPGIADDDLPHVFERLYVSRREPTRAESGSGLGLAIVRELVGAMGGSVSAEQAPGSGARMAVRLPLVVGLLGPVNQP